MPTVFSPVSGAIVKIRSDNNKVFAVRFSNGGGGDINFNIPMSGFALEQNGNYQFLHTLNDFIYVYSFGDRVSELVVSGLGFATDSCNVVGSSKPGALLDFYAENRLFKNGKLSVTLGDSENATFYAFLTGMRLELQDAQTMIAQWSLRFNVVPKKK